MPQTISPRAPRARARPTRPARARREGDREGRGRRRAARSGRPRGSSSRLTPAPPPRRPRRAARARRPRPSRRPRLAHPRRSRCRRRSSRPRRPRRRGRGSSLGSRRSAPIAQLSSRTDSETSAPDADARPGADDGARLDRRVGRDLGPVTDVRPAGAGELGLHRALEDVPARLQVALRGPDVHPVALQPAAVEALADEPREDLALDRDRAPGGIRSRTLRSTT